MFNGAKIKFQYKIKNQTKTKSIKLNSDENLEDNFRTIQRKKDFGNNQYIYDFYLLKNNTKIKLDKNKKAKELDLKEGDQIFVSFEISNNEIQNTFYSLNESSSNINEEINSSTDSTQKKHSLCKKRKCILLIIFFSFLLIVGCILLFIFIFDTKKEKIINNNNDNNKENNEGDEKEDKKPDIEIENTQRIPQIEIKFQKEDLVVNKVYPPDRLFIFKGQQLT